MTGYFKEIWVYRELLIALTLKEIKIRYKQTLLGIAWAILQPAALTIIFTVVFSLILQAESTSVPYPIFAYSALLPWTFFSTSVSFGSLSLVTNSNLVTKVYFPREILPFASIGAAFFDFIMASTIFVLMMFYYRINPSLNLFFIFLIVPAIFIFTLGVSMIFSTINVMYRDVRFVVPLILQLWLYLTPIIYSIDKVPDNFRRLFIFNPMAPLLQSFRDVTVIGKSPNFTELATALIMSILIFILGYWFFKSKERIFADII